MISDIATLLTQLMASEKIKIAEQGITHGPTIGSMYEGLTKDILSRTIPSSLNLQLVNGFIQGIDGALSPQIDCMLVTGTGRKLPYTDSHVWGIENVIAVIEVKKNLYGRELEDGFTKLRSVYNMSSEFARKTTLSAPINLRPITKSFAQLSGLHIATMEKADGIDDDLKKVIFHFLVLERFAPIRIIWGYEGYANEYGLRKGVLDFIENSWANNNFYSPFKLPNLIVCANNSVAKMSGCPYLAQLTDRWWHILLSNGQNPLRILIEMLWTRLENQFGKPLPQDSNLIKERLYPLLRGQVQRTGDDKYGWIYDMVDMSIDNLSEKTEEMWEPEEISTEELTVVTIAVDRDIVDIREKELIDYAAKYKTSAKDIVDGLVRRRLLAWETEFVARPIHNKLYAIYTPDGSLYNSVNANLTGEWVMNNLNTKWSRMRYV